MISEEALYFYEERELEEWHERRYLEKQAAGEV